MGIQIDDEGARTLAALAVAFAVKLTLTVGLWAIMQKFSRLGLPRRVAPTTADTSQSPTAVAAVEPAPDARRARRPHASVSATARKLTGDEIAAVLGKAARARHQS